MNILYLFPSVQDLLAILTSLRMKYFFCRKNMVAYFLSFFTTSQSFTFCFFFFAMQVHIGMYFLMHSIGKDLYTKQTQTSCNEFRCQGDVEINEWSAMFDLFLFSYSTYLVNQSSSSLTISLQCLHMNHQIPYQ